MRSFPEIVTLLQGLAAALRNVLSTLIFLLASLWVFAIIFVQQYKDFDGELHDYFSRLGISMVTLFIRGTLCDELASVGYLLKEDNLLLLFVLFAFVLIS